MNEHEVANIQEIFMTFEPTEKGAVPTLWDTHAPSRTRAVCLTASDGRVEIHTDPDLVRAFLDQG